MRRIRFWLVFLSCVFFQFHDDVVDTSDGCDSTIAKAEILNPRMDVSTENETLECKRKLLHELVDKTEKENLHDVKRTDASLQSDTKGEDGHFSGTELPTEAPNQFTVQLNDSDTIQIWVNNSKSECGNETGFYHNISIAAGQLPPLLQQEKNKTFVRIFQSDNCSGDYDTVFYHLKDFVFIKHTFNDFGDMPLALLVLTILSDSFEDILNRVTLEGLPEPLTMYNLTPLDLAAKCSSYGTCSDNRFSNSTVCYCDDLCPVYNDCCLDADKTFRNSPNVLLHKSMGTYMTCLKTDYLSPNGSSGYLVINKCPDINLKTFEDLYEEEQYIDIKRKCESAHDDAYFVPVVSLKTNLHYRNAYCALCHNENSYIFWSQKRLFQFGIFGPLRSSVDVISVHPPQGYEARVCFNLSFTDCPDSLENFRYGRIFSKLCRSHQNPVATTLTLDQTNFPNLTKSFSVHKNMYCLACNTRYIPIFTRICLNDVMRQQYGLPSLGWIFRTDHILDIQRKSGDICQSGEIWQSVLRRCVKLECPMYQTPYNGSCQDVTAYLDAGMIQLQYFIKGNISQDVYSLFIYRSAKHLIHIMEEFQYVVFYPFLEASRTRTIALDILFSFQQPITISRMYGLSLLEKWTFMYSGDSTVDFILIPRHSFIDESDVKDKTRYPSFSKEFKFLGQNESNFDYGSVLCFTNEQRKDRYENGKFETCMNSSLVINSELIDDVFFVYTPIEEIVLTYAGMGLSSVALSITLFRGFKQRQKSLSSVKRILLHCMTVKLLTHITFLVGCGANDNDLVCYIIGVVLHYLWLCAFAWSSVCAYFFYFVFVLALSGKGKFLLVRDSSIFGYSVLGYTLPLIVVSLSVGFDVVMNNTEKSYGSGICFITGKETLLFGFAFPTCLMAFFNFVCFLSTVSHVTRRDSLTISWREKFSRYFPVCVRMSLLLSFTWAFGFLASWLDNKVFWLVFIVVEGLQGFILSLSFISCKSRRNIIRENLKYSDRRIVKRFQTS